MRELINKPLPEIPEDICEKMKHSDISLTSFEKKNEILHDPSLQQEVGYRKMADGSYLVSMICPMPGITPEMIRWWFWWHPLKSERYQVWYPGDHCSIHYSKKQAKYFGQSECPEFQDNTQYPNERIGGVRMPLRIDFVKPEEFGFSQEEMSKNDIPLIVCGHVGAFNGLIWHTEMAHIYKQTEDGLFLISRFWLGRTMNPLLRKRIITDKMAKGMAEHCCIEYRNLWEILPILYDQYGKH